jgi:hypothetical protein
LISQQQSVKGITRHRYMTIRGLTEHIGTDPKFHLYFAKDDNYNGCDCLENTYLNTNDIRDLSAWVQTYDNSHRIITRNSNIDKVIGNHYEANKPRLWRVITFSIHSATFKINWGSIIV